MEIFSKLKYYLPEHALFKLRHTLVHSHLIYELIVWEKLIQSIFSKKGSINYISKETPTNRNRKWMASKCFAPIKSLT